MIDKDLVMRLQQEQLQMQANLIAEQKSLLEKQHEMILSMEARLNALETSVYEDGNPPQQ